MISTSEERQVEVDGQVDSCRRKLVAAYMFLDGRKLSDIGRHFCVSTARATQLKNSGNRRILYVFYGVLTDRNADIRKAKIKDTLDFARECNFDMSLIDSIKILSEIGIDLSELTIKPA